MIKSNGGIALDKEVRDGLSGDYSGLKLNDKKRTAIQRTRGGTFQ